MWHLALEKPSNWERKKKDVIKNRWDGITRDNIMSYTIQTNRAVDSAYSAKNRDWRTRKYTHLEISRKKKHYVSKKLNKTHCWVVTSDAYTGAKSRRLYHFQSPTVYKRWFYFFTFSVDHYFLIRHLTVKSLPPPSLKLPAKLRTNFATMKTIHAIIYGKTRKTLRGIPNYTAHAVIFRSRHLLNIFGVFQ